VVAPCGLPAANRHSSKPQNKQHHGDDPQEVGREPEAEEEQNKQKS
jgi:hypothetical protein